MLDLRLIVLLPSAFVYRILAARNLVHPFLVPYLLAWVVMFRDLKRQRLATLVMLLSQAISLQGRSLEVKSGADAATTHPVLFYLSKKSFPFSKEAV